MTVWNAIGLVLAVLVTAHLIWALLRAEDF
jgi:K+-transporting ATPase KdpF subunit